MTTTGTTPGQPPARPATEWMKGAATAHGLVTRQIEAGYCAERIAAQWDQALASYDDTTATPAQRDWHAGAEQTARDMIETWRDIQRAEAEQALAWQDAQARRQAQAEHEAG